MQHSLGAPPPAEPKVFPDEHGIERALAKADLTAANVLWFVQSRTAMPDMFAVAFALGGALTACGGGLLSSFYTFNATMGVVFTMKALIVIIMGGVGDVRGAVLAALILGIAETGVATLVDPPGDVKYDVEAVLAHFAEDCIFTSPVARQLLGRQHGRQQGGVRRVEVALGRAEVVLHVFVRRFETVASGDRSESHGSRPSHHELASLVGFGQGDGVGRRAGPQDLLPTSFVSAAGATSSDRGGQGHGRDECGAVECRLDPVGRSGENQAVSAAAPCPTPGSCASPPPLSSRNRPRQRTTSRVVPTGRFSCCATFIAACPGPSGACPRSRFRAGARMHHRERMV